MPEYRVNQLEAVLRNLHESVEGLQGTVVVSLDGFVQSAQHGFELVDAILRHAFDLFRIICTVYREYGRRTNQSKSATGEALAR